MSCAEDKNGGDIGIFGGSPYVEGGDCGCETTGGAAFSAFLKPGWTGIALSGLFVLAIVFLLVCVLADDCAWAGWTSLALFLAYCLLDDGGHLFGL